MASAEDVVIIRKKQPKASQMKSAQVFNFICVVN